MLGRNLLEPRGRALPVNLVASIKYEKDRVTAANTRRSAARRKKRGGYEADRAMIQ
jgi:hypothetical protein